MWSFFALALTAYLLGSAGTPAEESPNAVVQRLFDDMSTHDADSARKLFTPDAMLYSVRADGTASGMPTEQWLQRWAASKDVWLERTWNPKLLQHGSITVFWADYDFHLNGKFTHCGVDCFMLLKTADGWKIAAITDTRETTACSAARWALLRMC